LTFIDGTGTDDQSMTFTGEAADINVALDGLTYTPLVESATSDTLRITVDNPNTIASGLDRASAIVGIIVDDDSEPDLLQLTIDMSGIGAQSVTVAIDLAEVTPSVTTANELIAGLLAWDGSALALQVLNYYQSRLISNLEFDSDAYDTIVGMVEDWLESCLTTPPTETPSWFSSGPMRRPAHAASSWRLCHLRREHQHRQGLPNPY